MKALLTGMEWLPDEPGAGGLPRYFHGLVQTLPAAGVGGTALVSYLNHQPSAVDLSSTAVRVLPMAMRGSSLLKLWQGALAASRSALEGGVDLMNVHFALYALASVRRMPRDLPLVVHFHGPWAEETAAEDGKLCARVRSIVARRIELAVYRRATLLVTLSEAFAHILRERYGIPAERIRVVPGGVNLQPYFATPPRIHARERLGWPTDRPILLTVRRLVRRMGLELLIEAMQSIRQQCPDVLLFIGGKGPLASELQSRIDSAGLAQHVRLLGLVPESDLPLAYAAADLSIVPTIKLEGFGLVTAEALASGTPVLGTPVGGTPEILRGLDAVLVLEAVSASAITDRAIAALRGTTRLPSAQQCRAYSARYDWQQVAPRIRGVYEEAVRARSA